MRLAGTAEPGDGDRIVVNRLTAVMAAERASQAVDGLVSLQSRMRSRSANSHAPSTLANVSR
jgi:hypothetical protein